MVAQLSLVVAVIEVEELLVTVVTLLPLIEYVAVEIEMPSILMVAIPLENLIVVLFNI